MSHTDGAEWRQSEETLHIVRAGQLAVAASGAHLSHTRPSLLSLSPSSLLTQPPPALA